jgi:acyl-coenzyme A thioesterase PaaI-like protein
VTVRTAMSSERQGFLRNLNMPAVLFRRGINLWPPFLGAGITVTRVSDDYREIDVKLKLGVLNRNYFGTQFGGSLFAMTDPFFALMMLHNLGPEFIVWDKAGTIRYEKPGRGEVHAHFRLTERDVERARSATARGEAYEPTFSVAIADRSGAKIAHVDKTLHIRRKRTAADARGSAAAAPRPVRARRGRAA